MQAFPLITSGQHFPLLVFLLVKTIFNGVKCYFIVVLICSSLMIGDIGCFVFHMPGGFVSSSFEKGLRSPIINFYSDCFYFYLSYSTGFSELLIFHGYLSLARDSKHCIPFCRLTELCWSSEPIKKHKILIHPSNNDFEWF